MPAIRRLHALDETRIDALVELLVECVHGGASVSFLAPLTRERAAAFWRRVAGDVAAGDRVLLVAEDALGLCGTVQLVLAQPENQPHRADLVKLLVPRRARRRGVGAALVGAAEDAARACGRTLLVLDAVAGGDAARLYERLGWVRVGSVPGYALAPDGAPCAAAFYYRSLTKPARAVAGRVPWLDRRWAFDLPAGNYADAVERLRGTPARLEERLADAAHGRGTGRRSGAWSIQENVGHLLDLEELWRARTRALLAGAPELPAADPSNRRTHAARHDEATLADLLARFRAARGAWVAELDALAPAEFARAARHARLGRPLRLVDLCVFAADHDDHHLARIAALLRAAR